MPGGGEASRCLIAARRVGGLAVDDVEVRRAEASEALARFVSTRDFWRSHLCEVHAAAFERLQQRFWGRIEALAERAPTLGDGAYLEAMNQLTVSREMALDAWALRLTEEALRREASAASGMPRTGETSHPD